MRLRTAATVVLALPMLVAAPLVTARDAVPTPTAEGEIDRVQFAATHPMIYVQPGAWRLGNVAGESDPVAAWQDGDEALLAEKLADKPAEGKAKPLEKRIDQWSDAAVDRLEQWAVTKGASAPLIEWLHRHRDERREFLTAISPAYDDAARAIAIFDELRQRDAKTFERFVQLAIAISVVWDQPDAVTSSRYVGIWGIETTQFLPVPTYVRVWDYFTDEKNIAHFVFPPQQLPWSVLVHLVDFDVSDDEIAWARQKIEPHSHDIAGLYPLVPYDHAKLGGHTPKLGDQQYVLKNLLACGGVCGDQAHFTSRAAKCFAVPAMKVTGEGRYGGAGHAWAGYLAASKSGKPRPVLEFTGRYFYDYYYTGQVFDPQTRLSILDRSVAMVYDAVSQPPYAKHVDAELLARGAAGFADSHPQASITLAQEALARNRYCASAWRTLMRHIGDGKLTRKAREAVATKMFTSLGDHPDVTLDCLVDYLRCVDDIDERQSLYENALKLYAQRPDLQIRLRMLQSKDLMNAHREPKALEVALLTIVPNAKEGTLVLPLVRQAVDQAKAFAVTAKNFRLDTVKEQLRKAEKDFPKQRGNEVSQAWVEFQKMEGEL